MREIPIGKLAQVLGEDVDKVVRAVKINLFNGVIRDTRVDTGRLRGNWQTTTGSPAVGEIARLDPSGNAATADVESTVKSDSVDYLTNNLPYAAVWDERDGMIARNVARVQRTIEEAVK